MIFSGVHDMNASPFENVFIHGIVRDGEGRKMSKSLGNGVDPLEIINKYGADSLRFSLVNGISPGSDMRYSEKKVESCRNFANKLWNATRFVMMNVEDGDMPGIPEQLELEDKWILDRLNTLIREMTENMEHFDIGVAVAKLYDFIWDCYCDWYIELAKTRLNAGGKTAADARAVLLYVLTDVIKLLHPFMPFVTEEIFTIIPHEGETLMLADWPVFREDFVFGAEAEKMERIMSAIKAIRTRRSEMNVPPSKKAHVYIQTAYGETFEHGAKFFDKLASASAVEVGESFAIDGAVTIISDGAKILIPLDELVDKEKELARLNKELEKAEKDIAMLQGKLANEKFVAKAPANIIEAERSKLAKAEERKAIILETMEKFR